MPNVVIAQIYHPATTAEKYDGIVFTNISGKNYPNNLMMTQMMQPAIH